MFSLSNKNVMWLQEEYKRWVALNPGYSAEIENILKWSSFGFTSQSVNSELFAQFFYAVSKLLELYNDKIIYNSVVTDNRPSPYADPMKVWITILHNCQVLAELAALKVLGIRAKWFTILFLQSATCIAKIKLLVNDGEQLVDWPVIKSINRDQLVLLSKKRNSFIMQRKSAGKHFSESTTFPVKYEADKILNKYQFAGEIIYITKPLFHLLGMYLFGTKSWKPWMLALTLDLISLNLMEKRTEEEKQRMIFFSGRQSSEITGRYGKLMMYLMRSPFYEWKTKRVIHSILVRASSKIPMSKYLFDKFENDIIPVWQSMYFYTWS